MLFPDAFANPPYLLILAVCLLVEARAMIAACRDILPVRTTAPPAGGAWRYAIYLGLAFVLQFLYFSALQGAKNAEGLWVFMRHAHLLHAALFMSLSFSFCHTALKTTASSALGIACVVQAADIASNTLSTLLHIAIIRKIHETHALGAVINYLPSAFQLILYALTLEVVLVRYWPRRRAVGTTMLAVLVGLCLALALVVQEALFPVLPHLYQWAFEGGDLAGVLEITSPVPLVLLPLSYALYLCVLIFLAAKSGSVIAAEQRAGTHHPLFAPPSSMEKTAQESVWVQPPVPASLAVAPSAKSSKPAGEARNERGYTRSYASGRLSERPHNFKEQDMRTRGRRRYGIIAASAIVAALLLCLTVNLSKGRAIDKAVQEAKSELVFRNTMLAAEIKTHFDAHFDTLRGLGVHLLDVSGSGETPENYQRLAAEVLGGEELALAIAYRIGEQGGSVERTGNGGIISAELPDALTSDADHTSISDAYAIADDEAERYFQELWSSLFNPYSPYGNRPIPPPTMAATLGLPLFKGGEHHGCVWMDLSLDGIKALCDEARYTGDGHYANVALLTHEESLAYPPGQDEAEAGEALRTFIESLQRGSSAAGGVAADRWGTLRIVDTRGISIGDTGQSWYLALDRDYGSVVGPARATHNLVLFIGLFLIFTVALIAALTVRAQEVAARQKTAAGDGVREGSARQGPAFMEKTKGLRRQRIACRLLCVLFFLPSLFFIAGREKAFEKALEEGDVEGMRRAVSGMWPPALVGLCLGLVILWINFVVD